MRYDWDEIDMTINGEDVTKYTLSFDYDDGTPCYDGAKATIKPLRRQDIISEVYLENMGIDLDQTVYYGEVGATNLMAEYLSNGWDRFFSCYSNDIDDVFDEVEDYIVELLG